jgi:hypothetical protein
LQEALMVDFLSTILNILLYIDSLFYIKK